MTIQNLDRILRPRHIAVIGASASPASVGHSVLRNLLAGGFEGPVYPVNPRHDSILGLESYGGVGRLPVQPDLAVVCTPAAAVPGVLRECGEAGVLGIVIISAGFGEASAQGREREAEMRAVTASYPGMRILGPNCVGIVIPPLRLNASFAASMPGPGGLALLSQSGALCTAVLDWAAQEQIGFSCLVSLGNMLDVGFADLIDSLADDRDTRAIILYVESIRDAREFMSAARSFTRTKPIVAYKAGRFAESARAAASHTGAMAGEDVVYQAAFQRAGIVRVHGLEEMFDCAELLARQRPPRGARLAIVSNAGGPAVMATDALLAAGGTLASLSETTLARLNETLPAFWSHANPVDVLGDASAARLAGAVETVQADEGVDAVLVIMAPQAMTDPVQAAEAVAAVAGRAGKPVLAAWIGGEVMAQGRALLDRLGVPAYRAPEAAVRAFMHLVEYTRNLEVLYETPREVPIVVGRNHETLRQRIEAYMADGRQALTELESKALLEAADIPVNPTRAAASADEAVATAADLGFPVVLKILAPQILHKSEVDGVALNLQDEDQVRAAFERLTATARQRRPDAEIIGVTVQPMVAVPHGVEMILGMRQDRTFGSALMVGFGGIAAELYRDRAVELPPLNERLARRMLESLRCWPLLCGYRSRPAVDLEGLIEQMIRLSYLVAELPQVAEIDINPLLATPRGAVALDARIILGAGAAARPARRPFEHLAIRPYPQQYIRNVELRDGTGVRLRPIRPEDEPMWQAMLQRCATASLWFRFRSIFKRTTHRMAARYCFIDYDRELAIVAEVQERGERNLVGVGRLVAGPEHDVAEYAVLVVDAWQNRGLGSLLTAFCLEIAAEWGVQRVVAETTHDNARMRAIFQHLGFQEEVGTVDAAVRVSKALRPPASGTGPSPRS